LFVLCSKINFYREVKQKKSTVTGIFNNFISDQSAFESKIRKEDLKRSIELKILKHVSRFTNDLVDKDYVVNAKVRSSEALKMRLLPKLKNSNNKYSKFPLISSAEKLYDTRGRNQIFIYLLIFFSFFFIYFIQIILASLRKSENENRGNYDSIIKNNEDSYYSEPEEDNLKKFNDISIKKNNDMFGKQKRDVDKFVLYKGMEQLNKMEHKIHQDKDDKAVSSVKFNFRYHNTKRQL